MLSARFALRPRPPLRTSLAHLRSSPLPAVLCCAALASAGCFESDDGREPPLDRIYFPTGIALSPEGNRLYVANSDWDLQFNAGSVQVYDAEQLRSLLPVYCDSTADCGDGQFCPAEEGSAATTALHWCIDEGSSDPCGDVGIKSPGARQFEPGFCEAIDNRDPELLLDSVGVGAFATTLLYRANPRGGGRLFIPVRSDATLHWIDVRGDADGDELDCGQQNAGGGQRRGHCDDNHRRGDDASEVSLNGEGLPIEPFGVAASASGEVIVTSHQTSGALGLFHNDWQDPSQGPQLQSVFRGLLAREVMDVATVPVPRVAQFSPMSRDYQPGFLVTYRSRRSVQLIRYFDEENSPTGVPFLQATTSAPRLALTGDFRSIAFDDSKRRSCENSCDDAELDCLQQCARVSLGVFVANQEPSSLLLGNTVDSGGGLLPSDTVRVSDRVSVGIAPTKVTTGRVVGSGGALELRAFVLSFAASTLAIVDPESNQVEMTVQTGRGPSSIAIDEENGLGFVTHFTDSYVGVIDLNSEHTTYGNMILSLGNPTVPRGDR